MGNLLSKFCVCATIATAVCSALAAQEGGRAEDLVLDADGLSGPAPVGADRDVVRPLVKRLR